MLCYINPLYFIQYLCHNLRHTGMDDNWGRTFRESSQEVPTLSVSTMYSLFYITVSPWFRLLRRHKIGWGNLRALASYCKSRAVLSVLVQKSDSCPMSILFSVLSYSISRISDLISQSQNRVLCVPCWPDLRISISYVQFLPMGI